MALGMFSPQYKDMQALQNSEQNRLLSLAYDPATAEAYAAYDSAKLAGQGLGRVVAGATGNDTLTPTERNNAAIQAAKQQVSQLGFDPSDPNSVDAFYKNVIMILQRQGLVAEAMDVADEWRKLKAATVQQAAVQANMDYKNRDLARKEAADAAKIQMGKDRNAALIQAKAPEYIKLVDRAEQETDPAVRKQLIDRLNYLAGTAGKGITFEDAGDRIIVRDKATNAILSTDQKGMPPVAGQKNDRQNEQLQNAYETLKSTLQEDYDAAVRLYNNPGLSAAVGPAIGMSYTQASPGVVDLANRMRIGPQGRAAMSEVKTVLAGSFVRALQQLKAQSSTGASGLGQLTEVEGDKIQSAMASLDPKQDPTSFRQHLAEYITRLVRSGQLMDSNAQTLKIANIHPLQQQALAPSVAQPARVPQPAPAQPAAPGAPASTRVRVTKDGSSFFTVPAAQLDAAKAQGYREAPR